MESDENKYQVTFTGREVYWLMHLANNELIRLQNLSVEEGNPMLDATRYRRWGPISNALDKLSNANKER